MATSLAPGQQLDLGAVGYCGADVVAVAFQADGMRVVVPAVSSAPVRAGVPIWVDPAGNIGNVDVEVSVSGPDGEHTVGLLHVSTLPAARGTVGDVSLAMIATIRAAAEISTRRLGAFHGDTAPFANALLQMQTDLDVLSNGILRVRAGETVPFGKLGGIPVTLDADTLTLMDELFVSIQSGLVTTPHIHSLQVGAEGDVDAEWFQTMVHELATGALERADKFASGASTLLAGIGLAAAAAGSAPAVGAIAVLGAVTFAATTFAPAVSALLIELAALPVGTPVPPAEVWTAVQPEIRHIVKQSLDQAVGKLVDVSLEPAGEVGQAVGALVNSAFDPASGVVNRVSNVIVGSAQQSCAPGVTPSEISFNPDYVRCPEPSAKGESGGGGPNPCFTGAAVAAEPAPWVEACTKLSPRFSVPLVCLDANPAMGVPAPMLSNGADPAAACKEFHNADGDGTSLGHVEACDHEVAMTCYCCPSGT